MAMLPAAVRGGPLVSPALKEGLPPQATGEPEGNRFAKQRLHWTLPHFSTTKLAERWSDLMPLLSWQLWLARQSVEDHPLPWQKQQTDLTPGRVAQGFPAILAVIGTPAGDPKPRVKSPGWPQGQPRQRRTRYPVVKKTTQKRKKSVK